MRKLRKLAPWAGAGLVTVLSAAVVAAALQPVPTWLYVTDPAAAAGQEAVIVQDEAVTALGAGDLDAAKQRFEEAHRLFLEAGDEGQAAAAEGQVNAIEDIPEPVEPIESDLAQSS